MRDFKGPLPGQLEASFRKDLGRVHPYMCLADVATDHFIMHINQSANPDADFAWSAKRAGQGRLYLRPGDLPRARSYLHLSHIAYIVSRGDALCSVIRSHKEVASQEENTALKGCFLRKTVYLLIVNRALETPTDNPPSYDDIGRVMPIEAFKVLDYFRQLRNEELHGDGFEAFSSISTRFLADVDQKWAERELGATINAPADIGMSGVLALSKCWQIAAKCLCAAIVSPDRLLEVLEVRYGRHHGSRRRNGALSFLQQGFLLDEASACGIVHDLGW